MLLENAPTQLIEVSDHVLRFLNSWAPTGAFSTCRD